VSDDGADAGEAAAPTIRPNADGMVPERVHAAVDGEVVIFVVGMRFNRLRAVRDWLPVVRAGARMRREQDAGGVPGLLGVRTLVGWRELAFLQYWASVGELNAYAHDRERAHRPAWAAFDERVADSDAVGIYHETYVTRPGDYETVYRGMPPHGLGATDAARLVPATGRRADAAGRMAAGRPGDADADADGTGAADAGVDADG
jgi:hypothetical protein